ncbi:MAG TPA: hypothetical protein VNJ01_05480 [Bacteriovoracaceae bacterium]|nr:hypothetical protein [Bacteriovoracaceae bacterium]
MDMKKKLESTYNPEKITQREKVVIGLSGGVSSYVSAFLLKLQKYDLIGVTIVPGWEESPIDPAATLSCHIGGERLESVKRFCQQLGIPHHTVAASAEFSETVLEPWMGSRILGQSPGPCWSCHQLRLVLLYKKMKDLGVQKFATGHFSKILHSEQHGTWFVHSSNDEGNDHSPFLARVSEEILACMYLPLSDLTKKEVLKLAENFGLTPEQDAVSIHQCFSWSRDFTTYFEQKIPPKLLTGGSLWARESQRDVGVHDGVIHHQYGESFDFKNDAKNLRGVFGKFTLADKRMILFDQEHMSRDRILLQNCRPSAEVQWLEPLQGFISLGAETILECWVYPKCLNAAYVEWEGDTLVAEGSVATVYKKKGKNSKVLLSGTVKFLSKPVSSQEGDKDVQKADYARDL